MVALIRSLALEMLHLMAITASEIGGFVIHVTTCAALQRHDTIIDVWRTLLGVAESGGLNLTTKNIVVGICWYTYIHIYINYHLI